ncbi:MULTISPECIES: TRAP transporter small permease [Pseudomonas]|uniref:TRAP transporter small permease protein n=1 Tax=Pseudomonas marincola TaxID=437900 RepID=A0A653E4A6_9PSED|nr:MULTISPECIES: TRAP transporter small permease [Pseudomonas]MAB98687.1 TRAP transporter permease DctQ [Pseudomonadaceae bacterium]MBQ54852.1 TRAP transporter permease DctQ [Pseudomonadaceae bacterium]NRH26333.1 TRAP transporter small permease [Pseudomonas sp. MS19]CAE6895723.1 C4-dicarboxylate ABC transporter [Pseudomonas marincola]HCP53731.1 TRAP transporter permease DctQ [Pseudomonas sp.]
MKPASRFFKIIDNLENYICRVLLALFVIILFAQILSRNLFNHSLSWTEELVTYMFVWFAFFGASYAAKLAAHNRVTFQFKLMPRKVAVALEALSDLIWVCFNCYFVYLSVMFFMKANVFWKSQTLGIPMKYLYLVLPIAFTLMTLRVLQVNYYKLVKGIDIRDPEAQELEKIIQDSQAKNTREVNQFQERVHG